MGGDIFTFKKFVVNQSRSAFKVGTDGVLLGAYANTAGVKTILDIGAGTGLIALMLAQKCDAEIVAIEPDSESFAQMCENIDNSLWNNRIKAVETTFQNMQYSGKFDLIITNPPYFSDSLKNPDSIKSQTRHNDTLSPADILRGVINFLDKQGRFQLILPYIEGNLFIAEAARYGLYCCDILKIKPLHTSEIKRLILTFVRKKTTLTEKFLTISNGQRHDFTEEYKKLTKDFYLKF